MCENEEAQLKLDWHEKLFQRKKKDQFIWSQGKPTSPHVHNRESHIWTQMDAWDGFTFLFFFLNYIKIPSMPLGC